MEREESQISLTEGLKRGASCILTRAARFGSVFLLKIHYYCTVVEFDSSSLPLNKLNIIISKQWCNKMQFKSDLSLMKILKNVYFDKFNLYVNASFNQPFWNNKDFRKNWGERILPPPTPDDFWVSTSNIRPAFIPCLVLNSDIFRPEVFLRHLGGSLLNHALNY